MPTRPFTVRRLGPADLATMRALNTLFGAAFGEPDTYGAAPPDDAWLENLLGREHILVLAALAGEAPEAGPVIGGLVAYELEKFERARREVYIYDLAVDEKHRRRGVATALIRELGTIAAGRRAWAMFVQADYGDDPAVALYENLGTREDVMHFDIAPEPVPSST